MRPKRRWRPLDQRNRLVDLMDLEQLEALALADDRAAALAGLSPGTVDTDMVRKNTHEAQDVMTSIQLMKRMASPDEMVGPALMLTSDAGSFITGQVVFADGGMVPR